MRSRFSSRLVSLAALLPLLTLAVSGLGYDRFRCTFTGEVSEVSCCSSDEAPALPAASASCCDHEGARAVRVPAEARSPREAIVARPALVTVVRLAPTSPARATLAPRADAQAPPSPPLRVLKQSFLI
jgi:hypothetical protein